MSGINLKGQNAIVTGAGQGMAKTTALLLAYAGANVWVADIKAETARETAEELAGKGVKSGYTALDISDQEQMLNMIDEAARTLGGLDIMCNLAGIVDFMSFDTLKQSTLERLMQVNIAGAAYGCQGALRKMRETGRGGKIVNMASVAGRKASGHPFYGMTRAAVINLTLCAAKEGAPHNIRVNAVNPGIVRTPLWETILDDMVKKTGETDRDKLFNAATSGQIPLGRPQTELDIANTVLFLVSDFSASITGQAINVDGGIIMA